MLHQEIPFGHLLIKENGLDYLQIRGEKYQNHHIWIPRLLLEKGLEGPSELYVEGNLNDLEEPRSVAQCYLTLPYTGLSMLEQV